MPPSELHHHTASANDSDNAAPASGVAVPDGFLGWSSEATTGRRVGRRPYDPGHTAAWLNNARRQLFLLSFLMMRPFFGPPPRAERLEQLPDLEAGGGGRPPDWLREVSPSVYGDIITRDHRNVVIRRRGASSSAAALAQEAAALSEVAKRVEGILNQCYAACLPTCVMSYPMLKDAPESVKVVMYGGLAFITLTVYMGMLSKSEARAMLAIRLVSCTAVTVLTFSVASQLSVPTYVLALTALAAGAMNLIILLLPI